MNDRLGQPGLPHGLVGRMLGGVMRWHNRPDNEWTLSLLDIRDNEQMLEVGFGPGAAIRLASQLNASVRITGVDHSPEMLAAAERLNHDAVAEGRVRLTLGSADHLQFADNSFDKVYSINCIYFWPAPARGLSELYRVVKRGGLVAVTVRDKERPPYDAFRPEKLTNSLIEAGFSSVAINHNDVPSHPLICAVGTK